MNQVEEKFLKRLSLWVNLILYSVNSKDIRAYHFGEKSGGALDPHLSFKKQ